MDMCTVYLCRNELYIYVEVYCVFMWKFTVFFFSYLECLKYEELAGNFCLTNIFQNNFC